MRFLFVHQNFPGQFRHVVQALVADPGHQVVGIGDARHVRPPSAPQARLTVVAYPSPTPGRPPTHAYLRDFEGHVRRGQQVARSAMRLKAKGFEPDVVVVHPGWGEGLFLREVYPRARHLHYCEFYYAADGADVGFDPEFPATPDDRFRVNLRNATQLLGLTQCDAGVSPTRWQRSRYPAEYQPRIRVLHEGIDASVVTPDAHAALERDGKVFRAGQEIVTFVARNLEPYRGFHRFMRALPRLLAQRPQAQVIVVGGDEVSYSRRPPAGQNYRELYAAEIDGRADRSRIHFVGKLAYADYLKVLQVSAAHVYLTYPFVLSWSMLEAMAAGCVVVASDTLPVRDVIVDGDNGLLVDFFDADRLADRVAGVLADPPAYAGVRSRARQFIQQHYDLRSRCVPAWVDLLVRGDGSPAVTPPA